MDTKDLTSSEMGQLVFVPKLQASARAMAATTATAMYLLLKLTTATGLLTPVPSEGLLICAAYYPCKSGTARLAFRRLAHDVD